jgi:lipid-A-disaccharide synthase
LKESDPDLDVWGVGGPALEKTGTRLLYNSQDLAVVGILGVIHMLPLLAQARASLLEEIRKAKPDTVLLVDYGGFNLSLAAKVREAFPDLPIIYFISPQVWGSRPWRIKSIARNITTMLVIFPFEETLYRARGIDAHFIGHPLTDRYADITADPPKQGFCDKYGIDPDKPLVGIFPGSRKSEIKGFMPILVQAISWLHADCPEIQFAISQATPKIAEQIYDSLDALGKTKLSNSVIKFVTSDDNRALMSASDVLWTKSGTTTLEAAFMEKPMLVYYRADWVSFVLFVLFKTVKYISWPNLLAGKMLVPELIQLDCRAEQLVRYTRDLLDVPGARASIAEQLRNIKSYLRKGDFAANAAEHLQKVLDKAPVSELKVAE